MVFNTLLSNFPKHFSAVEENLILARYGNTKISLKEEQHNILCSQWSLQNILIYMHELFFL